MAGYLGEGSPRAWLIGIRKHSPSLLSNYPAFVATFKAHFGDPDFLGTTTRRLTALCQTGASVYAARFRELVAMLDLTEFSRCEYFYNGLKEEVKDGIIYTGRPSTLDEHEKLALAIDSRIYTRALERSRASQRNPTQTSTSPAAQPPPTTQTTPAGPVPMEVDIIRHGPLTPAERQHRRDQNLCMYCGAPGHQANTCTKLSDLHCRAKPATVALTQKNVQLEVL